MLRSRYARPVSIVAAMLFVLLPAAFAQNSPAILSAAETLKVVPSGFYFEGQSGTTQRRNSAAARLADKKLVIAGLVDTSGYATEVKNKYEGFLITDSSISINGMTLATGAYGFGFSSDGKMNVFDVGGSQVISVSAQKDTALKGVRPLQLVKTADGIRLYSGRNYVVIAAK